MNISPESLSQLCAIAEEAGAAIMQVYGTDFTSVSKDDHSPLTLADLRADAIIRARLEQFFPGVYILSEESRSTQAPDIHAPFFLVDPLDGTKEFIQRSGEFTVNIALIVGGVAVAGVVYAPALDQLYYACQGQGAWSRCNAVVTRMQVASWEHDRPLRVIGSRSHGGEQMMAWLHTLGCEYTLVKAGSSLKFCMVAAGKADMYPRLAPTSQWDTAAAQCIVEQAGGEVILANCDPLTYGFEKPILNNTFVVRGGGVDFSPPIEN